MNILFVGDVHGRTTSFKRLCAQTDSNRVIQVGDMGLGFSFEKNAFNTQSFGSHVRFIRGNHDNPETCRKHPNYYGEFGFDEELNLFYAGGAFSIDRNWRTEGASWWKDEELTMEQCYKAQELYVRTRPKIVVTHDCPLEPRYKILSHHDDRSRTSQFLQSLFDLHQPQHWFFGHHHVWFKEVIRKTEFQCIPELQWIKHDSLA